MSQAAAPADTAGNPNISIVFVWIAVLIFAAANSIVLLLFQIGEQNLINGRNPIQFCNVLFIGNVCACLTLIAIYRRHWTRENLSALGRSDWAGLLFLAALTGAISPSVIFFALENTTVTNIVLVGRIEPFVFLALSSFLLKESTDLWAKLGAGVCFAGVVLAFFLESQMTGGLSIGKGEMFAALGAVLAAVGIVVSKLRLKSVPLGIFTVIRTGVGAAFFFTVATYLFGLGHFQDVFSPFLWQWMIVYGAVIVVGGQYFWFTGIKNARTSDVSLASSFTPIAAVGFAFLLLGERPGAPILIGGAVIVAGIAIGQFGNRLTDNGGLLRRLKSHDVIQAECRVGFKGV